MRLRERQDSRKQRAKAKVDEAQQEVIAAAPPKVKKKTPTKKKDSTAG